jgi:hypothetical protein
MKSDDAGTGRAGIEPATHGFSVHCPSDTTADSNQTCNPAENHLSPDLSVNMSNHAELADLIRAWPELPEALRAGITGNSKGSGVFDSFDQSKKPDPFEFLRPL